MNNYTKTLKYPELTKQVIDEIEKIITKNPNEKILLEIPNTKGVSSSLIDRINSSVSIRIADGYNDERINRYKKSGVQYIGEETLQEYFIDSTTYTKDEVKNIIQEMEKIEKGLIGQNYTDLEKTIYIYGKLKSGIMYDPRYEQKASSKTRSLRGLTSKNTVCAGYTNIFMELLARQGIQSYYVRGDLLNRGGHAWNVVTINGKHYPIDLTWDNGRYRAGKSGTYDYFAQDIEEFKKIHVPSSDEPCKDLELSSIDKSVVEQISHKFKHEQQYAHRQFYGTREDGSKYKIVQVGDINIRNKKGKQIGDDGKSYFKYIYYDIQDDGKLSSPTIVCSETNVASLCNAMEFGKKGLEAYNHFIDNVLFAKENINNAIKNGTRNIGYLKENNNKEYEYISPGPAEPKFMNPTKEYKRDDGTSFIVQYMGSKDVEGQGVKRYHIFENIDGEFVKNEIYSEQDVFQAQDNIVSNMFLSRSRLERKARDAGGYVGYVDENGQATHHSKMMEYIKSGKHIEKEKIDLNIDSVKLTPEQSANKRKWIENFIEAYDLTETEYQKQTRIDSDERCKEAVKTGIDLGIFRGNMAVELDAKWVKENASDDKFTIQYSEKQLAAMARFLKAAKNMTDENGKDYLERFSNIQDIDYILLQMKKSDAMKELKDKANTIKEAKNPNVEASKKTNENVSNIKENESKLDEFTLKESFLDTLQSQTATQEKQKTNSQYFKEYIDKKNNTELNQKENQNKTDKFIAKNSFLGTLQSQTSYQDNPKTNSQSFKESLEKKNDTKIKTIAEKRSELGEKAKEHSHYLRKMALRQMELNEKQKKAKERAILNEVYKGQRR